MILFLKQSEHQHIELEGTGERFRLWLDGCFQFDSADERAYHEVLANLPLALAERTRSVLILGGGDGLCAREALKYPVSVVNVELDEEVAAAACRWPIKDINRDSFGNPRVSLVIADATEWVRGDHGPFDVVIADFPSPTRPALERLFSEAFYRDVKRLVAPGGVLAVQTCVPTGRVKELRGMLGALFGHSVSVLSRMAKSFDERFVFASDAPIAPRRDLVDAPHALPLWERIGTRTKDCLALTRG